MKNPSFLLPIYNLGHHQECHPRTKNTFADVEYLWILWSWSLPNIPCLFLSHLTDFTFFFFFFQHKVTPFIFHTIKLDNIKIFILYSPFQSPPKRSKAGNSCAKIMGEFEDFLKFNFTEIYLNSSV